MQKVPEQIKVGRVARDEEPDTCIFGADGVFFGRVVGGPECDSETLARWLQTAWNCHGDLMHLAHRVAEVFGDTADPQELAMLNEARAAILKSRLGD